MNMHVINVYTLVTSTTFVTTLEVEEVFLYIIAKILPFLNSFIFIPLSL